MGKYEDIRLNGFFRDLSRGSIGNWNRWAPALQGLQCRFEIRLSCVSENHQILKFWLRRNFNTKINTNLLLIAAEPGKQRDVQLSSLIKKCFLLPRIKLISWYIYFWNKFKKTMKTIRYEVVCVCAVNHVIFSRRWNVKSTFLPLLPLSSAYWGRVPVVGLDMPCSKHLQP